MNRKGYTVIELLIVLLIAFAGLIGITSIILTFAALSKYLGLF